MSEIPKHQLRKLNKVAAVIKYYENLIKNGRIAANGSAAQRMRRLKLDYKNGRRWLWEKSPSDFAKNRTIHKLVNKVMDQ